MRTIAFRALQGLLGLTLLTAGFAWYRPAQAGAEAGTDPVAVTEAATSSVYPHLQWTEAAHDAYRLTVSPNSDYSSGVVYDGIQTPTFTVPNALERNATYYWKAEAVAGGESTEVGQGQLATNGSDEETVYSDDFNAAGSTVPLYTAVGAQGLGSYPTDPASTLGTVAIAPSPDGQEGQVVHMTRTQSSDYAGPGVSYKFPQTLTGGNLNIDFDVYKEPGYKGGIVYVLEGTAFNFGTDAMAIIDDGTRYIESDIPNWSNVGGVDAGAWTHYRIQADLMARTFDIFSNGTKMNATPMHMKAGAAINNFSAYSHFHNNADAGGGFDLDNVRITLTQQAPAPALPVKNAQDVPTAPSFQWADSGADSYDVVLSDAADLGHVVAYAGDITGTSYVFPDLALDVNKTYYWKVIGSKAGMQYAQSGASAFTTAYDADGNRKPAIFETAPESAGPNETVQIVGENFDSHQAQLYRLPDADPDQLIDEVEEGQIGTEADLDADAVDWTPMPLASAQDNVMSAVVPADVPYGQYAITTRNEGGLAANVAFQNRTEVLFAYPDRINQTRDREIRVIGVNLSYDNGSDKSYVFLKDASGHATAVTTKSVSKYEVAFDLPTGLADGSYEVWTTNGHGGQYGWGAVQTVDVYSESAPAASFDVRDYGAIANDNAPDTAAIQGAIDAAANGGGGTVNVPAGTFLLDGSLTIKPKVTLEGTGRDSGGGIASVLRYVTGDPIGDSPGGQGNQIMTVQSETTIEGLKIVGSVSVDRGIVLVDGSHDITIRNNIIDNFFPTSGIKGYYSGISSAGSDGGGGGGVPYFHRIVVDDNDIKGNMAINLTRLYYSRFSDNRINVTGVSGMIFGMAAKNIVERNHVNGLDDKGNQVGNRSLYFGAYGDYPGSIPVEMNYIADNELEHTGTAGNDGEIIVFDNFADSAFDKTEYYGDTASATSNSVTVAADLTPHAFKDHYVTVVGGKGMGQWRRIVDNDAHTFTIEGQWTVAPNNSKINAGKPFFRNIVTNNNAKDVKAGGYYGLWGSGLLNVFDHNEDESQVAMSQLAAIDYGDHANRYGINYYNTVLDSNTKTTAITYIGYLLNAPRDSVISLGNVLKNNKSDQVQLTNQGAASDTVRNTYGNVMEHNDARTMKVDVNGDATLLRENRINGGSLRYVDLGVRTVIDEYPLLPAPANAYGEPGEHGAELRWTGVSGAEGYYVLRKEAAKGDYVILNGGAPVSGTSFVDATPSGTFYHYLVIPWNAATGQGKLSVPVYGYATSGVNASSAQFADAAGSGQWSYRDGSGALAYDDAAATWKNGDGSAVLSERTTSLGGAAAAERIWEAPHNGKLHYYGFVSGATASDAGRASVKVMLGDTELKPAQTVGAEGVGLEGTVHADAGEQLRFVVTNGEGAGAGDPVNVRSEFAVDYTRDAPMPAEPQDGYGIVDRSPTFRWTPVSDADNFELIVSKQADFSAPVIHETGIEASSFAYEGTLDPSTKYYWKVVAHKSGDSWEGFGASFTTVDASREVVATYNFNLDATGVLPNGFVNLGDANNTVATIVDDPNEYDKSIKLAEHTTSTPKVTFDLPETLTAGTYEITWKSRLSGDPTTHFLLWFGNSNDSDFSLMGGYGRYMRDWQYTNQVVKMDTWQQFKVTVDLDHKLYAITIDGNPLISGDKDVFPLSDLASSISKIKLEMPFAQWVGSANFDDISVTRVTAPLFVSLQATPTTATTGPVTVTAAANGALVGTPSYRWAAGEHNVAYFAADADSAERAGTAMSGNAFQANANGTYTVYARDEAGNEAVATIIVGNIGTASGGGTGSGGTGGVTPIGEHAAGTASVTRQGDLVVVNIPAGATDQAYTVTITKLSEGLPSIPSASTLLSSIFELVKNFSGNFLEPITLTFAFDASQLKKDQTAAVFYYDESAKAWVKVGGNVTGSTITVAINHFTKFAVFAVDKTAQPSLNDIGGHWAQQAIEQAVAQGIVGGYADGSFKPNRQVSRAEFAVMLARAFKLPPVASASASAFKDDAAIGAWAKDAIAQAVQAGIVHGYADGTFRPNAPITRAEMATMIAAALGVSGDPASSASGFADDASIPAWAKSAAQALREQGIVTGRGGNTFVPAGTATRAEAVTVLMRSLTPRK